MSSLASRVRRTIRRYNLLEPRSTVLAAVSGGADSVALVLLLRELHEQSGGEELALAGLAHVNHGLRGEDAQTDEAFCRALAAGLGLPLAVERLDVRTAAREAGLSLEDAARRARYAALERLRTAAGADVVAVGHTQDDQAETVLLQLGRGAGLKGLGGMAPRRSRVVRPLLEIGANELRAWLRERGQKWVEDATNADTRLRRNAVRHVLLPRLREVFGPGVAAVLARTAEIARADEQVLAETAAAALTRVSAAGVSGGALEVARLTAEPLALQRRVLRLWLEHAGVGAATFEQIESVRALFAGETGSAADLGTVRVQRTAGRVFSRETGARSGIAPFRYDLAVPGLVHVPEAGVEVRAEFRAGAGLPDPVPTGSPVQAILDAAAAAPGLAVRSWRPGDAIRPLGLGGRKKLQDVFVDRRVPRADRSRVPLVVDAADRVLWVPGHALDETCRVTAATTDVVVLSIAALGGSS